MMADAWDVQLDMPLLEHGEGARATAKAIGGIHLSAWGIGCMCLAPSSAAPRTKKLAAFSAHRGHPGRRMLSLPPRGHCMRRIPAASSAAAAKCVKTAAMCGLAGGRGRRTRGAVRRMQGRDWFKFGCHTQAVLGSGCRRQRSGAARPESRA